jgi:tetratricopeptide (TPR) repeat protein
LKTGDLSRGDEIGQQAIALAPRDYRNWAVASQISLARSEPKLATSRWAMAMRFWPRYVQISPIPHALRLNPIGLVWVDALRQAHPHWSHQLGDEMMKAGEHHTAILAYEQAQSLSSSQRDIPQLGLARVLVGEEEAGLAALQILVERYPSYPWVVRQQALAFEHLERYEEAAKGWAQAARTGQGDEAWRQCIQLLDLALLNAEEKKKKSLQRQQRRCQSRCHSCQ